MFSSGAVSDDRFTIYSQLGQRSQTWVNLRPGPNPFESIGNGRSPVVLTLPLPASANNRSIVVTELPRNSGSGATEQTPNSPLPLIPSYRLGGDSSGRGTKGQRQRQDSAVEVVKGDERYRGLLLDVGPDSVVILGLASGDAGNRQPYIIRIAGYDSIMPTLNDLPETKKKRSRVQGETLQIFAQGVGPVTLTYLLDGLRWEAHHTIVIDTLSTVGQEGIDNPVVLWRIGGAIQNTTDIPFTATKLRLVAGAVNQPHGERRPSSARYASRQPAMMEVSMGGDNSGQIDEVPVDDYVAYDLPDQPLVLGGQSTTDVEIHTLTGFPVRKIYKIRLDDPTGADSGPQRSRIIYRLRAPEFIPGGSAIVYQYDPEVGTIGSLLGSVAIKESQRDQEVDLNIGQSSLVTANVTVNRHITGENDTDNNADQADTDQKEKASKTVVSVLNAKITNRTARHAIVIVSYTVDDRLLSVTGTQQANVYEPVQKGDQLEWVTVVPPHEELEFGATVTTTVL